MIGYIVWPALAVGCFALAVKGFSKKGMPLTRKKRITGVRAAVIGVFCLLLGLACSGMALFLVLDAAGSDPLGVDRGLSEAVDKSRTVVILSDISCEIVEVQLETYTDPPSEMAALVGWLGSRRPGFLDKPFVGKDAGTLRDAWGREFRLILGEGSVALASCGPNGTWEQGGGDDIVGSAVKFISHEKP